MVIEAKEYILHHYFRTFGEQLKKKGQSQPDYTKGFKHVKEIDIKGKLRAMKLKPNFQDEETMQIKRIVKDISKGASSRVARRLSTFGSLNLAEVPLIKNEDKSSASCSSEDFEHNHSLSAHEKFLTLNASPKSTALREMINQVTELKSMINLS